jgi:hypothetical protein
MQASCCQLPTNQTVLQVGIRLSKYRSALFQNIPQCGVGIPHLRFGTTYRSIFKGQEIPKKGKIAPIGYPETSARIYHSTLRKIPQRRWSRLHRGGRLKSGIFQYSYKISNSLISVEMSWVSQIKLYKLLP